KLHRKLGSIADEYYPIFKLQIFSKTLVFVRHPEDIKTILTSRANINKSSHYDLIKFVNDNDGINVSVGDKWRLRRKLVTPAFSLNALKTDAKIIKKHGEGFVKYLKTHEDTCIHEAIPLMSKLNLDIVCETTMGVNINECGIEGEANFREGADFYAEMPLYRAARPYIRDWMVKFIPIGWKRTRLMKKYNAFLNEIIEKRRALLQHNEYAPSNNYANGEGSTSGDTNGVCPIDILLRGEREGSIDSQGVHEEAESLIFAGFKTAALTMAYTLLLLAENESIQELARNEVVKVFGDSGGHLELSKLKELEYLERCIKETLRMFPAIPRIGRRLGEETKLSDYVLPAGSEVLILIDAVHRDPKFWPNPDEYDPDRFLPENGEFRHSHCYLPFSSGSRICLGYKYAMLTMKIILSMILNEYRLEPVMSVKDLDFEFGLDLKPRNPIHVRFIKINS
ncbi:hypothetical protein QAD02_009888, partial [Eretmocerus hayati]